METAYRSITIPRFAKSGISNIRASFRKCSRFLGILGVLGFPRIIDDLHDLGVIEIVKSLEILCIDVYECIEILECPDILDTARLTGACWLVGYVCTGSRSYLWHGWA